MSKRRKPPSKRKTPSTLQERLTAVTRIQVAYARQMTDDDDDKIRADVKAGFAEATEGDKEYLADIKMKDGVTETCVSMPGLFRTVFAYHGLDRKDQWQQERWWEVVSAAMEEAIAETDGDFKRRSA